MSVQSEINRILGAVGSQASLIEEITGLLEGKASGGGGGLFITEIIPATNVVGTTESTYITINHNLGFVPKVICVLKKNNTQFTIYEAYMIASVVYDSPSDAGKFTRILFNAYSSATFSNSMSFTDRTEKIASYLNKNEDTIAAAHSENGTGALVKDVTDSHFTLCGRQGNTYSHIIAGQEYIVFAAGK